MMVDIAYYYPVDHEIHTCSGHPENPDRIEAIKTGLISANLWDNYPKLSPLLLPESILAFIHSNSYLHLLNKACETGANLDADTYTTPGSYSLAVRTAGGAAAIAEAVWKRDARKGFALCRPPGHHASRSRGKGFCLINNIAIAAEYLIQKYHVDRISIIDLDLHHGNGTQDIFWERDDVLYISIHQWPHYPGTGDLSERGKNAGLGTTYNLPAPAGSGDVCVITYILEIILPILNRFLPEILLVSLGFDGHWRDPLGSLRLSSSGYADAILSLSQWSDKHANGRLGLFLEGGYDLEAMKACGVASVSSLLGKQSLDPLGKTPVSEDDNWRHILQLAKDAFNIF